MTIQYVPYYHIMEDLDVMTDRQLNILVIIIYLSTLLFICELCLVIFNIWTFLIRQGKYKTIPLSLFYLLTAWLVVMRIYYSVWYFSIWFEG